jgi:putative phosphonate metabolism protein
MTRAAQEWSGAERFAIYYAPPRGSAWWEAGCAWLSRDPESGEMLDAPQPAGLVRPLADVTVAPFRYGWHGTLVPPFHLAPGVTPEAVLSAVQQWAATRTPFALASEAATLGSFVALRPADEAGNAALRELAGDALRTLNGLRARQTPAELARRLDAPLTARQRAYVEEWGYPYVFEEFRFHMTLSDSLDDARERDALVAAWNAQMADAGALPVEGVALFVEPQRGAPFELWRRVAFAGGESRA